MEPDKGALILEVMNEIRRQQGVSDTLEQVACERMGINRTDARCVDFIDRAGRISAGELAEQSGLTTGSVTALLDRMERDGYVRRVPDEHDRRRVMVELTERVHALTAEVYDPVKAEGLALLEGYTPKELTLLRDFLQRGTSFLVEHTARLHALGPAAGVVPRGPGPGARGSRLESKLEQTLGKVDRKMTKLERKVGQSREKLERKIEKVERRVGGGTAPAGPPRQT